MDIDNELVGQPVHPNGLLALDGTRSTALQLGRVHAGFAGIGLIDLCGSDALGSLAEQLQFVGVVLILVPGKICPVQRNRGRQYTGCSSLLLSPVPPPGASVRGPRE